MEIDADKMNPEKREHITARLKTVATPLLERKKSDFGSMLENPASTLNPAKSQLSNLSFGQSCSKTRKSSCRNLTENQPSESLTSLWLDNTLSRAKLAQEKARVSYVY